MKKIIGFSALSIMVLAGMTSALASDASNLAVATADSAAKSAQEAEDKKFLEEHPGSVVLSVPIGGERLVENTGESNSVLISYIVLWYSYLKKIIATLAAVMIVAGGVIWTTSGGDQSKVALGKDIITRALLGLGLFIIAGLIL